MGDVEKLRTRTGKISIGWELLEDYGHHLIWQVFTALKICPLQSDADYLNRSISFSAVCPAFAATIQGAIPLFYNLIFETESERIVVDVVDDVNVYGQRTWVARVGLTHDNMVDLPEWEPDK